MGDHGKRIRLKRILRIGQGTLAVAFDHALVHGPISGTTEPIRQIQGFCDAQVDAVLINLGAIGYFAETLSPRFSPGLIARLDWTNALGSAAINPTGAVFQSCLVASPEAALRAGADAVISFLVVGSGDAEFEKDEIRRVAMVARECEQIGLPLIVESVARGPKVQNPHDPQWVSLHTRMAAELGADLIKTEYTGDPVSMRAVVEACPIPVLVLGGSRANSDQAVLDFVQQIVQSGADGVFFGRNVFQSDDMPCLLQRIRAVLQGTAPAKDGPR